MACFRNGTQVNSLAGKHLENSARETRSGCCAVVTGQQLLYYNGTDWVNNGLTSCVGYLLTWLGLMSILPAMRG